VQVLVTGGTGFVGQAVVRALIARGDNVTVLTRKVRSARKRLPRVVRVAAWTADGAGPWCKELEAVDAVVHLAGAPIAQRWTASRKKLIMSSRIDSTRHIVEAIGRANRKPEVLVSASGTGYYGGHRPGVELDENDEPGDDFVAKICIGWEAAARAAEEHGVRTVQLRTGVVLGAGGGALAKMLTPLGVSKVGPGDNVVSWVQIDDVVGLILTAIEDSKLSGAINCTAPSFTTGAGLAEAIGSVAGKGVIRVPTAVVRWGLSDAVDVIVGSLRVYPRRAIDHGYEFAYTDLTKALEASVAPE
jgi:uncharacterized protein (TIGR01777 family)